MVTKRRRDSASVTFGARFGRAAQEAAPKRREFQVELFVDAVDEKAVWTLLKQLKNVEGAGLSEEPSVDIVDEEKL